ncbi:MAG: Hsp20/alpha crystallin family protein [Chthoniobacterales bacterium]
MNLKITRCCLVSAVALTLSAPQFLSAATPSPTPSVSPSPAFSPTPLGSTNHFSPTNLDQRTDRLDNQLDSVFANTFRNFGDWFGSNNLGSSIDLRDQRDKYVVRVYVPGSDTSKVNARVENNTLHVTVEGGKTTKNSSQSERYEQIVSLPGPVDASKMRIER